MPCKCLLFRVIGCYDQGQWKRESKPHIGTMKDIWVYMVLKRTVNQEASLRKNGVLAHLLRFGEISIACNGLWTLNICQKHLLQLFQKFFLSKFIVSSFIFITNILLKKVTFSCSVYMYTCVCVLAWVCVFCGLAHILVHLTLHMNCY